VPPVWGVTVEPVGAAVWTGGGAITEGEGAGDDAGGLVTGAAEVAGAVAGVPGEVAAGVVGELQPTSASPRMARIATIRINPFFISFSLFILQEYLDCHAGGFKGKPKHLEERGIITKFPHLA
jgi:hypothetical protein